MEGMQLGVIIACCSSWFAWILSFYGSECLKILPNESMAKIKAGLVITAAVFEAVR